MMGDKDPDRPNVEATNGIDPEYAAKRVGAPKPIIPETGQHKSYWVLSAEERLKGFIRPLRFAYRHVGARPRHPTRSLTPEQEELFKGAGYVAFEPYPDAEETGALGRYWTQAQLDSGCGTVTTMSRSVAETYARQPDFYGSTFCVHCREHFPVGADGEFVWEGTDEKVGT